MLRMRYSRAGMLLLLAVFSSARAGELADLNWWSLKPVTRPAAPQIDGPDAARARTVIDHFIIAKQREHGLALSPEADRRTLIRRLYYDIIGLPPSPREVERFINDSDADAYGKLVDELLDSERHGERWARHWLDVIHYGDTHGYDKDKLRPNAWPYRDYVIRAFNEDKPYARFVEEQLAGDVLWPDLRDGIEATGFIAAGPWDFIGHAEVPEEKYDGKVARHLDRDDMVATTMNAFCALTVQCAQCHDHKRDPVTMEDYYSLQAVFAALDRADRPYDVDPAVAAERRNLTEQQQSLEKRLEENGRAIEAMKPTELIALEQDIASLEASVADAGNIEGRERSSRFEISALTKQRDALVEVDIDAGLLATGRDLAADMDAVKAALKALPAQRMVYAGTVHTGDGAFKGRGAMGGKPRDIHVLARGDIRSPGKRVGAGSVPMIPNVDSRFNLPDDHKEGARRVALAKWIVHRDNPLTWRAIVNRVWLYHFGRGIVDSANDFGRLGQLPTHPELLDWLAAEFRDGGQSIKALHRLIVTSAVYRQSSAGNADAAVIDGGNRFLWRMNRRKIEAEALRDSVLLVSGKLDTTMHGPGFRDFVLEKPEHSPHYQYHKHDPDDAATHRRSIYRFLVRSQPQPFMDTLDCADPSLLVDKRNETLTALQALATLNNKFMVCMAEHFAARLEAETAVRAEQIKRAYELTINRAPTVETSSALVDYANEHGLASACRIIFNLNEFAFVD